MSCCRIGILMWKKYENFNLYCDKSYISFMLFMHFGMMIAYVLSVLPEHCYCELCSWYSMFDHRSAFVS